MTVFQNIDAFAVRYGLICASCGSHMHIENRGASTRARCLARHCASYGWVSEVENEKVRLIATREDGAAGEAIDVTPEQVKVSGND